MADSKRPERIRRVVIVGKRHRPAALAAVRRIARRLARRGIAARLTFLGSLEGRDKAAAFITSKMIVVPSWTEAFPLVIPEAMAAGLPVIATAVGAIPDFVKDGEDGFLIAPKDPQMLEDRICRLLDDEGLRRRISERVRARALREFTIEVGCGKVAEVAKGVLGGTPTAKVQS